MPLERIGHCIFRLNVSIRKHLHLLCILFNVHIKWNNDMKRLYLWPESLLELSVPFVGILHVSSVL